MLDEQGDILLTAEFGDESLVAVGFLASEMEITMQGLNAIAQLL